MATINNVTDPAARRSLARNLQIHAWYLLVVNSNIIFDNSQHTLKVRKGFYNPGPTEQPSADSINDLLLKGRAVVYELVSKSTGQVDVAKTFYLASYLKDFLSFDKLILSFDTYDPSGVMDAEITIITPEIPTTYVGTTYKNLVETRFNGKVVSTDSIINVAQPPGNVVDVRTDPTGAAGNGVSGALPSDGVVKASNPNPNALPKQNIIDAIAIAVRALGPGYAATITPQGGRAGRATGTDNHPPGDAIDHFLSFNGQRINPSQNGALYQRYIQTLVNNANSRGVRPGIGGYSSFIHYDESPWRQGKPGRAGTWSQGFDVSFV